MKTPPTTDTPAAGQRTPQELLSTIEEERDRRWRAGDRVLAEAYLEAHPSLAEGEFAVQLVYGEYLLREEAGETPSVEEFQRRFPAMAERLARQVELHRVLAAAAPDGTPPSDSGGAGLTSRRRGTRADNHTDTSYPGVNDGSRRFPRVAGFEMLEELGHGGMAVVYRARDTRLNRVVALKMIRSDSLPGREAAARFRVEAEAVARLRHPHVVEIFEVGEADGVPYMALEYLPGGPLSLRLRENPLPPREAAELVESLACGVEAAHAAGIVHRDLKPGNVLLAADGTPRVADFGLAKRIDAPDGHTHSGVLLGTPSYMAPEQASGGGNAAGPAADVYGLGAILYECLTGRPPFKGSTILDTLAQVCTADPVPPSRFLLRMPADLQAVCLKCLEKSPARRYASAAALADDLRRWLDGKPTLARPLGTLARVRKLVRRNPLISAAMLVTIIAIVGGAGVAAWFRVQAAQAAAKSAEDNAARVVEEKKRATADIEAEAGYRADYSRLLARAERFWQANAPALAGEALDACPKNLREWEWHYHRRQQQPERFAFRAAFDEVLAVSASRDGKLLVTVGGNTVRRLDAGGALLWDGATGARAGELVSIHGPQATTFQAAFGGLYSAAPVYHTGPVTSAALSPDGRTLVTATRRTDRDGMAQQDVSAFRTLGGEMLVWDIPSGRVKAAFPGAAGPIAFSADGSRVAACCEGRLARVWDVTADGLKELPPLPTHRGGVSVLALSPDGKHLAIGGMTVESLEAGNVRKQFDFGLFDATTGQKLPHSPRCDAAVECAAFSPDGTTVAAGCLDGVVRRWEVATGRPAAWLRGHANAITALAFSGDGKTIATGGADQAVKVWAAADGHELQTYRGHDRPVTAVAFYPAGGRERLVSAASDGIVRAWDPPRPTDHLELVGHDGPPTCVAFSPDLPILASVCRTEATVRLWDPETGRQLGDPLPARAERVAFGPGGLLATTGGDQIDKPGELLLWDATTRTVRHRLVGHKLFVMAIAFSPDGKWLASAGGHVFTGEPNSVRIWDTATGKEVRSFQPPVGVAAALAFSPDGRSLAVGGLKEAVAVCDPDTGRERVVFRHAGFVRALAFAPDGKTIAVGNAEGFLAFHAAGDGQELQRFRAHAGMIFSIAYHPGGRRVATASYDMFGRGTGEVRLWDVTDGREVLELPGEVWVAFSADGRRLAAPARGALLGESNAVRVWDGGPFPLEATFRGEGTPLFAVATDPTGQVVATSGSRYVVTLYDRAKRKPPRELTGHTSHVGDVDISPDGRLVASASDDRTIRLWDISTGKEVKKLEGDTGQVTRVRFDPTGEKLISTGADRAARVWDVATGRELIKVDHPEGKGMDLALSADGGRAVICAENGVRIWDVTTGETLRQIRPPHPTTSVAWRDGTLVTGDNTGLVHVWDAESGEHRRQWESHSGTVWGLAFTREGILVSGGSDRLARAWNPDTGKRVAEYPGHFDTVRRVRAVPEGFATVSWDGTVRFWAAPGKQP